MKHLNRSVSHHRRVARGLLVTHLAAAEDVARSGLDVEVPEDPDGLVSGLFGTVQGQTAALGHLGAKLQPDDNNASTKQRGFKRSPTASGLTLWYGCPHVRMTRPSA